MTVSSLGEILDSKFDVCSVYVEKNYDYESTELSVLPMYVELSRVVKLMNEKHPVPFMTLVENSHDVVQYLMILMNEACGLYLFDFCENGLLREQSDSLLQNAAVPDELMPFKQQGIVVNRVGWELIRNCRLLILSYNRLTAQECGVN